eukprot:13660944-Heterocapsa_arctica.AAC.1
MSDDDWNFLIIGNDERLLELNDGTELVHGVICLGEADQCIGTYGVTETVVQQVTTGEIREFNTPSHSCTIHVLPCAIVFGRCSSTFKAIVSPTTAIISRSGKVFDRVLIEGCCGPDLILCSETKA